MDHMTPREIMSAYEAYYDKEKVEWERVRSLNYATVSVNSKKTLKLTDIMKFPWDHNSKETSALDTDGKKKDLIERIRNRK